MTAPDPLSWRRVRVLVADLIDLEPAARDARLAEIATREPGLAGEIRSLVAAAEDPSERLERAVLAGAAAVAAGWSGIDGVEAVAEEPPSLAGLQLGTWRLTRLLGRGGMAEVWEARRTAGDFEQTVAVKLLKRGMDSEEIVRRFVRERQILARLDHPGIARLFDGGLAPDGRPYLVLEKVDGEPITAWCARRRSSLAERLRLLVSCCEALAAAHQKLVVHRDLKPSNILVIADGPARGHVKLLDFGIAKLLADDDSPADATRTELRILTPSYAAPEQIRGEPVSTATDVYSLAVLAYELVTGRHPHRRPGRALADLASAVERESIVRPSTAVLEVAPDPTDTPDESSRARRRRARALAGDLDLILLTALRREPERRYPTVAAFADDLVRFLEGRPIAARRDRLGYRVRKFVGRHRVAVAAGAVAVASLFAGLGTALWQARRAEQSAIVARAEASKTEAIADFLTETFTAADPEGRRAADLTVRELVARGAERIRGDLAEQPATRAAMLHVLGTVEYRLARYEPARELLEEALGLRRALEPAAPAEVAATATALGVIYHRQGRSADGVTLLEEALDLQRRVRGAESLEVASVLNNLANGYRGLDRTDDARATFERAIAILERLPDADPSLLARVYNNYGLLLDRMGEQELAKRALESALQLHESTSGPTSALVVATLGNLSALHVRLGDVESAVAAARRSAEISERTYGPDHYDTGNTSNSLAWALLIAGRYEEARAAAARAVEIFERALGPEHSTLGYAHRNHGEALAGLGRDAEAIAEYRRAVAIWEVPPGAHQSQLASVHVRLAPLLLAAGETEEAERLYEQVVGFSEPLATDLLGPSWLGLARARLARCRLEEASQALARTRELAAGAAEPLGDWAREVPAAESELHHARCQPSLSQASPA